MLKTVTKNCKGCGIEFTLTCEVGAGVGSGGTNKLKRQYHDNKCKVKNSKKFSKIEKECIICKKIFNVFPSTQHKKLCSTECKVQFNSGPRVAREKRNCVHC